MKHLRTLLSSLLISLLAGISGVGYAEDVDIYIRQADTLNDSVRPNILFMLDNSGSMSYPIRNDKTGAPLSQRRIDVLQEALTQMLAEVHNVNVGLGRFAQLIDNKAKPPVNAPIMFPVFYIDADLKDVPGEKTQTTAGVSVRLANSTDDAAENLGSGKMYLSRPDLEMVTLKTSDDFKGIKIEQPIDNAGTGAAVEWLGTSARNVPGLGNKNKGWVRIYQSTIVLGTDPNRLGTSENQGDALVGLRFTNLAIPVGATIERAEIEFISDQDYAYQTESDAVKLNIYGALNDGDDGDKSGVAFDKNIAGYLSDQNNFPTKTSPVVPWTLNTPLQQGQAYKTPDIKSILQAVVNQGEQTDRQGWNENNSIVFLIQSDPNSPATGRGFYGTKVMYSTPVLRLSWTIKERSETVVSGKSTWNTTTKKYNVGTTDQAMEYNGSYSKGINLGYAPQKKGGTTGGTGTGGTGTGGTGTGGTGTGGTDGVTDASAIRAQAEADYQDKLAAWNKTTKPVFDAKAALLVAQKALQQLTMNGAECHLDTIPATCPQDIDSVTKLIADKKAAVAQATLDLQAATDAQTQLNILIAAKKTADGELVAANTALFMANGANPAGIQTNVDNAKKNWEDAQNNVTKKQGLVDGAQANVNASLSPTASDYVKGLLSKRQTALDDAKTALTTAQTAVTTTYTRYTDLQTELTNAQAAIAVAQKAVTAKQAAVDKAAQDVATATAKLPNWLAAKEAQTAAAGELKAAQAALNILTTKTCLATSLPAACTQKLADAQKLVADKQDAYDQAVQDEAAAKTALEEAFAALQEAKGIQAEVIAEKTGTPVVSGVFGQKTTVGLRFQQVPIPKGAAILEASISFMSQGDDKDSLVQNARLFPLKLNVYGEKVADPTVDPKAFGYNDDKPSKRPKTTAKAEWPDVAAALSGKSFSSPDLSSILQELVIQDGWKSQSSMVFILENANPADFTNKVAPGIGGFRKIISVKDIPSTSDPNLIAPDLTGFTNLPKLTVKYSVGLETVKGTTADSNEQVVGLRFEGIDVPRGAKVVSASIDFTSNDTASNSASLMIDAEDSDTAATFTAQPKDITSRTLTGSPVVWAVQPWDKGATYTSPDLTPLVTKIVNRKGWCGGSSSLAFVVYKADGTPYRLSKSYDNAPFFAPTLNVEYDIKSVPKDTCIQQHYSGQLVADVDDAEEMYSGPDAGSVYLTSDALELGVATEARLVGFRFRDVPISKNSKVLSAKLILTARLKSNDAKNAEPRFTIKGEKSPDSPLFTSADSNLSSRLNSGTAAIATWDSKSTPALTAWQQNFTYTSPDLTPIIQEIISQDGWQPYNSMALLVTGNGIRRASAFKAGPTTAAILRIQVEGFLGDGGDVMTVRRQLKKVVRNIGIPPSTTPLVDSLYESAQYYRGGPVEYGRTRNNQKLYLVSHPGTYTGGTLNRSKDCTATKPFEAVCASEEITGYPIYTSPINSTCQTNHVVLLTDGLANMNASVDKISALMGSFQKTCDVDFLDPEAADPAKPTKVRLGKKELCGIDLARFLQKTDNSNSVKDKQPISTHTIGFQLGTGWKSAYQDKDGRRIKLEDGTYKYIDTGEDVDPKLLTPTFTLIPSGYAEDKQETADNLHAVKYLKQMAKEGGGNFYQANSVDQLVAAFKSIVSNAMTTSTLFAAPGVSINRFNNLFHDDQVYYSLFKPDRNQRWQGNIKKFRICQGTEGTCQSGELMDAKGKPAIDVNKYIDASAQSFWGTSTTPDGGIVTLGGAGAQVPPPGGRKIYTYLGDASSGLNHHIPLVAANNKIDAQNTDLQAAIFGTDPADDFEKVINWINGQDVNDENGTGDPTSPRWSFADPLHSSPGIVVYGGEEGHQLTKLMVGTNDGLIRMIDGDTGVEDWAFLPAELLPIQPALMANQVGERIYGMDTTPSFWTVDVNQNVTIEPEQGDFVKMYMGMRRGGANIYALDITGPSKEAPGASPKLMWVIKGNTPGEFERLGQTWSRPLPTHVKLKEGKKTVLLFGGGYHDSQDNNFSTTDTQPGGGNAIFMVDAETGQRLWWASSDSKANLVLPDMKYPIPSDLLLKDTDGDDSTDRIYVGDLGGQVWRIDLIGLSTGQQTVGILFAQLGNSVAAERRRFFYPPEMVRISDSQYSNSPAYDMVVIPSGTRPDPLEQIVHNRFYALRDFTQGYLSDSKVPAILSGELFDATDAKIQTDEGNARVQLVDELKTKRGWFINLQETVDKKAVWVGEKGISEPVVKQGKVYFTTYLPPSQNESACSFSEGKSRLYVLDIVNANSVYNLDGSSDEKLDRAKELPGAAAASTGVTTTTTKDGEEHVGAGENTKEAPSQPRTLERFFWLQK